MTLVNALAKRITDPAGELDNLRNEREFQAILDELEAEMAEQLTNVRTMEESGEIPPWPDPPQQLRLRPG